MRLRRRHGGLVGAVALALAASPAAAAPACGGPGRPVVELVLEVLPPDRVIGTTLEQHVRAELSPRGLDLCPAPVEPLRPVARLSLRVDHPARGPVVAILQVGDLVTDKRLERTVDLSRLPADSRPLAVAAAADELLRASWAELTLVDAPAPQEPPPPAVVHAVEVTQRPRPAPSVAEIGLVAVGADFFGHRAALGAESWIAAWFLPHLAMELRFGASFGLPRASPHGTAHADTTSQGVGLAFTPMSHDARVGARLEGGIDLLHVSLGATARGDAVATEGNQWTGTVSAVARGWVTTGPLRWTLGIGAVAALHAVRATDDGATVTSIEGVGGRLDGGLSYHFR